MKRTELTFSVALVTAASLLSACAPPTLDRGTDAATPAAPVAKVDLPPLVPLEASMPPETHADHAMRVDGLLARREKYLGQKLIVRGFLAEKYERPKDAKRFERPHAWLADTPAGGDKRLMLVGLDEKVSDALEVGKQYTVTGKFATSSLDGFVLSSGLLIYESIEGLAVPEDPKAPPR